MTSPPDAIFELGVLHLLPQNDIDGFATGLRDAVMPSGWESSPGIQPVALGTYLPEGVMIVGVWLHDDGSDDERLAILKQKAFAPPPGPYVRDLGLRAGLFLSAELIQFQASVTWPQQKVARAKEHPGIYFTDNITVTVSPTSIRTIVRGHQDISYIPDPDFTITIDESLALNAFLQNDGPADEFSQLTSVVTASNSDIDDWAEVASTILGIIVGVATGGDSPVGVAAGVWSGLAGFSWIQGDANKQAAGNSGVAQSIADSWLAYKLIKPEFLGILPGKIRFLWDNLTVDTTGVRTSGVWNTFTLEGRQPAVEIIGEKWLTIPLLGPLRPAIGWYTLSTTDLVMNGSTKIHWTGAEASPTNPAAAAAKFGQAGTFTITASVTDEDGFSATGSFTTVVHKG